MRGGRVGLRFFRRFLLRAFSRRYRARHPQGARAATDLPSRQGGHGGGDGGSHFHLNTDRRNYSSRPSAAGVSTAATTASAAGSFRRRDYTIQVGRAALAADTTDSGPAEAAASSSSSSSSSSRNLSNGRNHVLDRVELTREELLRTLAMLPPPPPSSTAAQSCVRQPYSSSLAHHEQPEHVASLECKLEALERKYEMQAARHQQLTNELSLLRRHNSTEDADMQTTPDDDGGAPWSVPPADAAALNSPHRIPAIRRAHSDSPGKGHFPVVHDPFSQGCSSSPTCAVAPARHAALTSRQSRSLDSTTLGARDAQLQQQLQQQQQRLAQSRLRPSRDDLLQWIRDRPAGSRLFRALFQYVPFRDSPNDNPEAELSLEPGDYVMVQGEIDEDLFYEGRLFDGTAGLVPSNYVERVDEHELYANLSRSSTLITKPIASPVAVSTSMGPAPSNRLPKPLAATATRRSIPANPQPADLLGPLPDYPSVFAQTSFLAQQPAHHMNLPSDFSTYPDVGQGLPPLPDSVCPYPPVDVSKVTVQEVKQIDGVRVPFPRDLLVERQLAKSVMISWSAPDNSLTPISQYHVCVDGNVKAVVPGSYKCRALVEDVDLSHPRRFSVRSVTDKGHSPDAACTVAVGAGASVAPEEVRACNVTPVSVQLTWYPANSNAEHIILLNGLKVGACPPGVFQVNIRGIAPSTMYRAAVRAKDPRAVLEERPVERCIDFKTLPKIGLPDPPAHVQVDPGPQDNTLLVTWRPVDTQPKPPSRAAVAAYLIYADGRKILEVPSPSGDHVLLRLSDFVDDPPLFITVRTKTREGAVSADSNVVRVPRSLSAATNAFSPKHGAVTSGVPQFGSTLADSSALAGGLLMVQPSPGQKQVRESRGLADSHVDIESHSGRPQPFVNMGLESIRTPGPLVGWETRPPSGSSMAAVGGRLSLLLDGDQRIGRFIPRTVFSRRHYRSPRFTGLLPEVPPTAQVVC
uniref:RIMS-binding protein 2 n=1 Tax=Plectus sambesii TaxID=2011161 RepID=A0A914W3U6_9BILA